MTEKFEQTPARPDIESMYDSSALQELIEHGSAEERERAVARLRSILQTAVKTLEQSIGAPTTDPAWPENLKKEKERLEEQLKALGS